MTFGNRDVWQGWRDDGAAALTAEAEVKWAAGDHAGAEAALLGALGRDPDGLPAHLLLARMRRPGPDYLAVLADLHHRLRPRLYVEIGVGDGSSLALVRPDCQAVAIDPAPRLAAPVQGNNITIVHQTSDAFFAGAEASGLLRDGFDLALIDGDHHCEQVLRDIAHLERHARPDAMIVLHDSVPLDQATSARDRRTTFYSGDVWKAVAALMEMRPDLHVTTLEAAPTGLTLVRGVWPRPEWEGLEAVTASFAALSWDDYRTTWARRIAARPSRPDAVAASLPALTACRIDARLDPLRADVLTGEALVPPDLERLPLDIVMDGVCVGTTIANGPRGPAPDGQRCRLAFAFALPFHLVDGHPHDIAVQDAATGALLDRLQATPTQAKPYHDPGSLLDWAFHHRVLCAPFSDVDKIGLAYFDWDADRRAAAPPACDEPAPGEQDHQDDDVPLVSVIMPCWNAAATLATAIRSVQAQQLAGWELIVVDDGSTDGSAALAAGCADPRVRLVRLPGNGGPAAARNRGLAAARGRIIAYLDADNWWDPRYLTVMAAALLAAPEWDAAYCGQYLFRQDEQQPFAVRLGPFNPALIDNDNNIDINCLVHRRAALDSCGGFDPGLWRIEDWEFILRLTATKAPLFVPVVLSHYRWHPLSPVQAARHQAAWRHWVERRAERSGDGAAEVTLPSGQRVTLWARPGPASRPASAPAQAISIVIPSFELPEMLRLCLERVFATIDPAAVEVILCDNGSSAPSRAAIDGLRLAYPTLRVDWAERNFGFTHAVNRGLALAAPDHHVVVLNNDALVTPGWLEALAEVPARHPAVGVVVPRQILLPGTPTVTAHVPAANVHLDADVTLSAHHGNVLAGIAGRPDHLVELSFAPFFCALLTRTARAAVERLDERRGRHYRSDSLYCEAVRKVAGLRILYTPKSTVYHLLQQSTHALRQTRPDEYDTLFNQNCWDPADRPLWDI